MLALLLQKQEIVATQIENIMSSKRFYRYFIAIAILLVHLKVDAQTKLDTSLTTSISFSAPDPSWEDAGITHSSVQKNKVIAIAETPDSNNSTINLWQADGFQAESSNPKTDYRPISIAQYWSDRYSSGIVKPSAIGEDPVEIALSALGLTEIIESEREEVELDYPSSNLATVTITQTNLADDSIAGIRYLVHFAPYGDSNAEKWQVVWAGQQFKCQLGRGDGDWRPDLCQ